ncbi:MAG TPA: hypothetical protein VIM62_08815 [Acidobacteriaceae bacterium]
MKPPLVLQAHTALIALLACLATLCPSPVRAASSSWDAAATQLANQIAAILGPGQAQIELTNRSAIPTSELPVIRRSIEEALRSHGIRSGSQESASILHITLSENNTERLWVAEILEGSQTQVAIVRLEKPSTAPQTTGAASSIRLERKLLWSSQRRSTAVPLDLSPILAALEWNSFLLLLSENRLTLLTRTGDEWTTTTYDSLTRPADARPMPRDARGALQIDPTSSTVTAYLPGLRCASRILIAGATPSATAGQAACQSSDDPWPLASGPVIPQKAFYNAARNYFTGVLAPGIGSATSAAIEPNSPAIGIELPPFYSAAPITASGTAALLIASTDGKPRLTASNGVRIVAGAHDWGSDLAALTTSCATTVLVASNSGEAREDSLRAYDLHGVESIAISEPLPLKGSVMALNSPANTDGHNGVLAILRISPQNYEVDRVSALCQ